MILKLRFPDILLTDTAMMGRILEWVATAPTPAQVQFIGADDMPDSAVVEMKRRAPRKVDGPDRDAELATTIATAEAAAPTPMAWLAHIPDGTSTPATTATITTRRRVTYRVINRDAVVGNGIPEMIKTFLIVNGPQDAGVIESRLRLKRKSIESGLHFLRTEGVVESVEASA